MTNYSLLYNPPNESTRLSNKGRIALLAVTLVALGMRVFLFPFVSRDYEIFLNPWFMEIQENGGFLAIGRPIGDYLPSYIYILAALSYLPISSLYSIKLVSFIGDIVMAVFAMKIVMAKTSRKNLAYLVYTVVMFLPTVLLNSGAWGQCDSLYTAALIACVYYMIMGKARKGMIWYSVAFIFKIQAVFLAPFILLLLIKKKIKFTQLFYVPLAYIIVIIPAALAGRNLLDLLTIYFRLAGSYSSLSLNAPNFYAFINVENTIVFSVVGVLIFLAIMAVAFYHIWKTQF